MVVDPDGGARNWNLFTFAGLFSLLLFVQNIPDLFKICTFKKYLVLDTDTFKILFEKKYLDTDTFKILAKKSI